MTRQAVHWATLTIAFLLELCALAALASWGVHVGGGPATKTALAIGAPLLAAVLWGLYSQPPAPRCRCHLSSSRCTCWSSARTRWPSGGPSSAGS
jgi:hypothetical protein